MELGPTAVLAERVTGKEERQEVLAAQQARRAEALKERSHKREALAQEPAPRRNLGQRDARAASEDIVEGALHPVRRLGPVGDLVPRGSHRIAIGGDRLV